MERCCITKTEDDAVVAAPARCPHCGAVGRKVGRVTVKSLLRPLSLARLAAAEHRFCATSSCPVVYFGHGEAFALGDVSVPVFQKEPTGDRTVCYCFAVTESDLRREIAETGRSTAAAMIARHVEADRCACELKNPQGSCCLGNVAVAARDAMVAVESPASLP